MDMECTCSALRMAARRLSQTYDAALAPAGVTVSQYAVLSNLAKDEGATAPTMTELSERLGLDRTTLAHNLRPLERDGLVAVVPDPQDARLRRVALTPEGRARRDRCFPLWRAAQDRFDASFGASESHRLRSSLSALARLP
ncbi:MAG: MarR family winged helix-turn-helix transcriptional regulator [Janthinobacterium lividum]